MFTRRVFLKAGGVALFTLGSGPQFLTRAALAAQAPKGRRKVLVTIFQRGAMDGLMAVTPVDETVLRSLRPRLAMSAAQAAGRYPDEAALLDLGVGFGLHPAFAPLRAAVEGEAPGRRARGRLSGSDALPLRRPGLHGDRHTRPQGHGLGLAQPGRAARSATTRRRSAPWR